MSWPKIHSIFFLWEKSQESVYKQVIIEHTQEDLDLIPSSAIKQNCLIPLSSFVQGCTEDKVRDNR